MNIKKITLITAGTLAIGLTGGLAAPAIAASFGAAGLLGAAGTGTVISTLSGAALTSASLAAIGTGTVASGTLVLTTTGAVIGACGGFVAGFTTN
ncbi:MAG: hypothetical protein H8E85_00580 [Candidatus Marinimicrobia bacterium]|nr:hypothetical protein [Candidatus Neomarinimicrobiota bacterium]